MAVKFRLVFDVLEHPSLAGPQDHSIHDKGVLNVLRRKDKPAALELANQQMTRSQTRHLAEKRLRQAALGPDDVAIFARITGSLRPNLQ